MRSPKLHRGHGLNKLRRRCDIILGILFSVNIVLFFLKRPNKASIANPRQSSTKRSASQLRRGIIKKQSSTKRSASRREEKRNDFSPPHPTFPRVFGARVWNKNVRCAFVTLLKKGKDITSYAGFLESSTRLRRTFQLKSEYPHYVVYEGQFPDVHQKGMILSAPWLKFYNVSHVWGNDYDRPPPEFWNATDRSEGYKHMCRFFGRQLFQIAALEIGLDIVMRVDDDILFLRQVNYDPFQIIWQSGAVYGFGSLNKENHFHTELTFTPWIREYCQQLKQIDYIGDDDDDFDIYQQDEPPLDIYTNGFGRRRLLDVDQHKKKKISDCQALAQSVIDEMYFNNVFITVIHFWHSTQVQAFADAIDHSHGIYVHRWGDAPMHTAALRLFASKSSVRRLPNLHYVHFSTDNLILDGKVTCLNCQGTLRRFTKLSSITRHDDTFYADLGKPVVTIDQVVQKAITNHRHSFTNDIVGLGIYHNLDSATLTDLPVVAFLQLVEKVGVWCDNLGFVNTLILLPIHCCCHLDTYRPDNEAAQATVANVIYKTLEPWINSRLVRNLGAPGAKKNVLLSPLFSSSSSNNNNKVSPSMFSRFIGAGSGSSHIGSVQRPNNNNKKFR